LSNVDKHRHLNLTIPQALRGEKINFANGSESLSIRYVKNGTEIERIPPHIMSSAVNVNSGLLTFIAFDEKTLDPNPSKFAVNHVLQLCLDVAETLIVPAFEKFIKNA
jgi:hypothetical protein